MVGAYGTLAGGGIRRTPVIVTRIEDREGNVLAQFGPQQQRALPASTSYTVIDMMRDVVDKGTAQRLRSMGVRGDVAGKTGTTQESADGWFIAAHPDLVMGAWVGFDDQRLAFRTSYWGQGGHNALFVVGDFAVDVQQSGVSLDPDARFQPPPGYQERNADRERWNDDVRLAMDSLDAQRDRLTGDTIRFHSDTSRATAGRTGTIRYRDDADATPVRPTSATENPTREPSPSATSPRPASSALPERVDPKPAEPAATPQRVPTRTPAVTPAPAEVPPPPPSRRGSSRSGGGNGGG
jgi:penicillin-binding protein 1A